MESGWSGRRLQLWQRRGKEYYLSFDREELRQRLKISHVKFRSYFSMVTYDLSRLDERLEDNPRWVSNLSDETSKTLYHNIIISN